MRGKRTSGCGNFQSADLGGKACMKKTIAVSIALAAVGALDVFAFMLARQSFPETKYRVYRPDEIHCITEGFPRSGPANAPVAMVEYTDFECAYSSHMDSVLDTIRAWFGPQMIAVYHKQRPLYEDTVRRLRVRAAYAAHRQGKFFEMKSLLTAIELSANDAGREKKLRSDIRTAADLAGLDMARFKRDIESAEIDEIIDEVVKETERYGIYRYPSLLINGHFICGVRSVEYYVERISAMLPDSLVVHAHQREELCID
ncbi:MAG: thioredoxin domain-containing protein [Chitinivibrionales bacterium]|nr:thioredoxin domain-containing protein [Chitinivibrionales bacterium]MBD3358854.1 thioredoxin domain-containing protein [Chitinivibrionales bacterium]